MWLTNSSVGRKVVMSVTGIALVLFLTFHMAMNLVALISADGYNMICEFLGANWYALVATVGLAALFVIHIIYAFWLTMQNRKARGSERYAVTERPKKVEWASQNMLVLGIIVILFAILHFSQFWYHMMFAELLGHHEVALCDGTMVSPQSGAAFINYYFKGNLVITIAYLVWYVALWFHLTHGFWSAIQTIGWNNTVWMSRWECISKWVATIICLAFAIITIIFFLNGVGGCCPASGCC